MLVAAKTQFVPPLVPSRELEVPTVLPKEIFRLACDSSLAAGWTGSQPERIEFLTPDLAAESFSSIAPEVTLDEEIDPFYLFACHIAWERDEEPGAAWELLAAARSSHPDTRAHARALLANSRHFGRSGSSPTSEPQSPAKNNVLEDNMKAPYGLEIIDDCAACDRTCPGFFCGLCEDALHSLNLVSHKSILPAGAILFVEGQAPRGLFIVCSGKVNLYTTTREGKVLILRTAEAGEALGLSAAISNVGYETTAETATPCQLSFVERKDILDLLCSHNEIGVHVAQCLSRDFQSAYRDIHHLVLNRSSAGKLARLLLSHSIEDEDALEARVHASMTHEEMGQRIGASRETVTRLLSHLRKKRLIRTEGATLIIRDRTALEALAV